jgi:type IV pilus assembly protein PilF
MQRELKVACTMLLGVALAGCVSAGPAGPVGMLGKSGSNIKETSQSTKQEDAARVRVELGQRYMEQGKYELAQENLQKALEYDSNYVDAHTVIAVLYEHLGQPKPAGEHYARAAELAPKNGAANNNYGQYLCSSGRYAEAQKYFARAMEDPFYKTPDVLYTNAGTCLLDHDGSQLEVAETDFRKALEVNPHNVMALYSLAKTLYARNDFFHARAFIQRFESLGQPNPDALLLARNIEVKLGHAEGAREYSQRLREQFPDTAQAHSLDTVEVPSH